MTLYQKLGIEPVINARGTVTNFGGSLMDDSTIEAMSDAAKYFVDIRELHGKAGCYIAELLGVEAACITSGASAGIAIAVAAMIAGKDKDKILALPDTANLKNEIWMFGVHATPYAQAARLSGGIIKEIHVSSLNDFEQMIERKYGDVACFLYFAEAEAVQGSFPIEEILPILMKRNIPLVVDYAAEIPYFDPVLKYFQLGVSLVIISGGKEFRGPQATGLILGKKEYVDACDANCCPNHSIGRSMKIDKESICGLVKAIELYCKKDYSSEMSKWRGIVEYISVNLHKKMIDVRIGHPVKPGVEPKCIPRLYIRWHGKSSEEIYSILLSSNPRILVGVDGDEIVINPQCLKDEDVDRIILSLNSLMT